MKLVCQDDILNFLKSFLFCFCFFIKKNEHPVYYLWFLLSPEEDECISEQ